ncbi:MAG: hypothetical protein LBO09_05410 [Candidatus Peribacteria bacterium]|jgi:hypothetical protein|nr:hypothetical protein [Candidatus Peribacteria bacterium]
MNAENEKKLKFWRDDILTMPEYQLFLLIEGMGGFAWSERHYRGHLTISDEDFDEGQKFYYMVQREVLNQLIRCFRIDPLPPQNLVQLNLFGPPEPIKWNYWQWYRFWKDWMNYFPGNLWKIIEHQICNKKPALSRRLPIKNWDDVISFDAEECLRSDALDISQEEIEDCYGDD